MRLALYISLEQLLFTKIKFLEQEIILFEKKTNI